MKQLKKFKYKLFKGIILIIFILMFFFPYASYQGASSGLLLWFINVLPTLLPFIILSNLMIRLNIAELVSRFMHPVFGRLFRISPGACYPILIGFLSGIPMGAKSSADLVSEGRISHKEGGFLLNMCNNASPIFIMNYIAINQLKLAQMRLPLFVIIYSSSIISALIYRKLIKCRGIKSVKNDLKPSQDIPQTKYKSVRFSIEIMDNSIMNGFEVVTKIGGYIILFSILAQIVSEIGPGSSILKATFMGFLEITTGINQICKTNVDQNIKIVLAAVLTSFGGLSGIAQTKSVLGDSRLSINSYFTVKLLGVLVTFLLTVLYVTIIGINRYH